MWSEGGTELFLEAFYIFLSQRVGLPGQFELLAVSPGQAEGGSIEDNLSKHWLQHKHRSDGPKGRFIVVDVLNIKSLFLSWYVPVSFCSDTPLSHIFLFTKTPYLPKTTHVKQVLCNHWLHCDV